MTANWSQHSSGPLNPEWMSRPVKVRRIGRGFAVSGRPVEMHEIVTVDAYTARGLIAMQRAELVEKSS